jgi:hypothetical protein
VIVSVHLADVGWLQVPRLLRGGPDPAVVPGLSYAAAVLSAPLREGRLPRPGPGRIGLIAAWDDDGAVDGFLASGDHFAERLADGWHVRLEPLRIFGAWSGMPDLPRQERPVDEEEPVVVLTLGRPRLRRLGPFLKSSAAAERDAARHPARLASTALARPPHLVSTFSVWRSAAEMRDYAVRADGPHQAAVRADRSRPFHHESAFIRFRPYASQGSWDGRDPLAEMARTPA